MLGQVWQYLYGMCISRVANTDAELSAAMGVPVHRECLIACITFESSEKLVSQTQFIAHNSRPPILVCAVGARGASRCPWWQCFSLRLRQRCVVFLCCC